MFWDQQTQHQVITVTKLTILHPRLDVTTITEINDTPKILCNRTQANKFISKHHMCPTDSDYDNSSEEFDCQETIEVEGDV